MTMTMTMTASEQGLDPITDALAGAGIDHEVGRIGGKAMLEVFVRLGGTARLGINAEGDWDDDPAQCWYVVRYADEHGEESDLVVDGGHLHHVMAEVAVDRYAEGVREHGHPEMVATCDLGMAGAFGEMVELAEEWLGLDPTNDAPMLEAMEVAFERYQERLQEELDAQQDDDPEVSVTTANHGMFSVVGSLVDAAWVTYGGRSVEDLRAVVEDRLDGAEDWSDVESLAVLVLVLAALDLEMAVGEVPSP